MADRELSLPPPPPSPIDLPDLICAPIPAVEGPGPGALDWGAHGSCTGTAPTTRWVGEAGYAGGPREACRTGFERDASGAWVLGQGCRDSVCSGRGGCVLIELGALGCECGPGLDDPDCGDER